MGAIVVGLTGGVASGKSTALRVMKRLGAKVIDADVLARKAVAPGTPGLEKIKKRFGNVLHKNGRLNRRKLAKIVFGNKKALADLNAIVHPAVLRMEQKLIAEFAGAKKRAVIVVDAPVMIESGFHAGKDALVVMNAPVAAQIKRLLEKKGFTLAEALARIKSQMPLKKKLRYADYVVDNDGSIARLRKNTEEVYEKILRDFSKRR